MRSRFFHCISVCALGAVTLFPGTSSANPIIKSLTVQVFQVCDDNGNNCASLGPTSDEYFTNEVNKIWNQAGISVDFSSVQKIDSTLFSNIDYSVGPKFGDLVGAYGGLWGRAV